MEDLRSKLRALATRRPSDRLDGRVLGALESRPSAPPVPARRVRLGRAIAAAALMGAVGFWAGLSWAGLIREGAGDADRPGAPRNVDDSPESKTIQVVVSSSPVESPFDFSLTSGDGPTGEWKTKIILNEDPLEHGGPGK